MVRNPLSWTVDPIAALGNVKRHGIVRRIGGALRLMVEDKMTAVYFGYLLLILLVGVIGPTIAPYHYGETIYADGEIMRNAPPSLEHPLGTNAVAQDVLSRLLYGARPTVITGILGGTLIISIGMAIGITAGYKGGRTDDVLMRVTDFVYAVPLIPFAIVLVTLFGIGFLSSVAVIGLLLWRGNARVLRSQVLQIRERPFVLAARTTGASTPRIIYRHILPNVAPMAVLFFAIGVGFSILIQATLAFLGVTNPFVPSWGIMVRNAYDSGWMAASWWWSMPPALLIAFTVLSTFMFGRSYERIAGQGDDEAFIQAG